MNQIIIGNFIAQKRKEQNLTQAALAEDLGVSNKTVSKWENGKCMPDYSIIEELCKKLDITISELINGEENSDKEIRKCDDEQILDLLKRTQDLEHDRKKQVGLTIIVMGIAFAAYGSSLRGSIVRDFFSGVMFGIAIPSMIIGLTITVAQNRRSK